MRSEITRSMSDSECEKYESDSMQQAHGMRGLQFDAYLSKQTEKRDEFPNMAGVKIQDDLDRNDGNEDLVDPNMADIEMKRDESGRSSESSDDKNHSDDNNLAHRKIFVGGLSWQTTDGDLREYFCQFGPIESCQIKYDATSKQPRGFGFVVFEQEESVDRVLEIRDQHRVRGKRVDPKPAKPSKDVSRKVFVGGLDPNATYEQILDYFSHFGKVESLDLPFDNAKCARKNYVFIAYATKQEALAATRSAKQQICGRLCDVRIAVPRDQILKMQSRASVVQSPIKFPAPQAVLPSAYACRNFSGPAGTTLGPVTSPSVTATLCSLSPQQDLGFTTGRFRTPYRSEPGCGLAASRQMAQAAQPVQQAMAQPNTPYQFAIQGNSGAAVPGQFVAPYQVYVVDQQVPQGAMYAPYCATTNECAVQPSMIAVPAYSTVVMNPGSPQQPMVQQQAYAYPQYATTYTNACQATAQPVDVAQPQASAIYPVPTTGPVESMPMVQNCPEMYTQIDPMSQQTQLVSPVGQMQYATQQVVYAPVSATSCMQPQTAMLDPSQMTPVATFAPTSQDSAELATSSSRKRPPNV